MKRIHLFLFSMLMGFACRLLAETSMPWNMEELYQTPAMTLTTELAVDGMQSLFYDGISYTGRSTRVYAYYKAPEGTPPEGGWPAVVCVHGGGGTAYYEWVQQWVDHGYAAIAMDLEGHLPELDKVSSERSGFDGAGPSRVGVFGDFQLPVEDQWFYQAVAQIIRAHSLIRSFSEVNPDKTGITGISWGGMLTCAAIQVDTRFKFAVPVYGCGFLVGSDGSMGDNLSDPDQQQVFNAFLGENAHFDAVTIPVFFINGTNDKYFPLSSSMLTATAVAGSVDFRFTIRMLHSHAAGWQPEEIYTFADSIVKDEVALPTVGDVVRNDENVSVMFTSDTSITNAQLCFTEDDGQWETRLWQTAEASIAGNTVSAELPEQTTGFLFTLTDEEGLTVSSDYQSCDNEDDGAATIGWICGFGPQKNIRYYSDLNIPGGDYIIGESGSDVRPYSAATQTAITSDGYFYLGSTPPGGGAEIGKWDYSESGATAYVTNLYTHISGAMLMFGLATDSSGTLYGAAANAKNISKYLPDGTSVFVANNTTIVNAGYSDGFTALRGLEFDADDNLYVCDLGNTSVNSKVYKFDGSFWSIFYNSGNTTNRIVDVVFSPDGQYVYTIDSTGEILKLDRSSGAVADTILNGGYSGLGYSAIDADGVLYVPAATDALVLEIAADKSITEHPVFGGVNSVLIYFSALSDADNDGASDWQEFVAGTDYKNSDSIFRISSVEPVRGEAGALGSVLRWSSESNRVYSIRWSTNLLEGFSFLVGATNLPATPPENVYTNGQGTSPFFYKIDVRH